MSKRQVFLTHPDIDLEFFFGRGALERLRWSCDVILNPLGRPPNDAELLSLAPNCEVIVSEWLTGAGAAVFQGNPSLKAFVRCGVEMLNVDMEAATREGVMVIATPAQFATSVAEFTLGTVLALSRNFVSHHVEVTCGRKGQAYCFAVAKSIYPAKYPGFELRGERIGLIGLGAIGREVARLAQAFGMEVVASDPYLTGWPEGIKAVTLEELLETARMISLHTILTARTRHVIGSTELDRMRKDAFLINTARGGLVDTDALCAALQNKIIAGAAIDAFDDEPDFSANPLLVCPNVILTPHTAGVTRRAIERQADLCVDLVEQILAGNVPQTLVNSEVSRSPRLRVSS